MLVHDCKSRCPQVCSGESIYFVVPVENKSAIKLCGEHGFTSLGKMNSAWFLLSNLEANMFVYVMTSSSQRCDLSSKCLIRCPSQVCT